MEVCNFEIAKKLKEKGFTEECLAYYTTDMDFFYNTTLDSEVVTGFKSFNSNPNSICWKRIDAPTISQVLKWLREEKSLHIEVVSAAYGYIYIISDTPNKGGTDRVYSKYRGSNDGGAWDDYNECVFDAIEYVIDNLI